MFGFKSMIDRMLETYRENEELRSKIVKVNADIEYLSMMADIELEQEESSNDRTEV